jgi:hypothetical protein
VAWKSLPLRLAYETHCSFRTRTQQALDEAGIAWEMAVDSDSSMTIEACLSADQAVHARLRGTTLYQEEIDCGGVLPELPKFQINMMVASAAYAPLASKLADMVRMGYCSDSATLAVLT